jgi:hypothetical protein
MFIDHIFILFCCSKHKEAGLANGHLSQDDYPPFAAMRISAVCGDEE